MKKKFDLDLEEQVKFDVATSICTVVLARTGAKLQVGCSACPPFDRPGGSPPGGEVTEGDSAALEKDGAFFRLENLYRGSFSKPGAEEIAAVFQGCEAHSENYGGTLLLKRKDRGYEPVRYASGFHPSECQTLRLPTGRDLLVCEYGDVHQMTSTTVLFTFDFNEVKGDDISAAWHSLLMLNDTSVGLCLGLSPDGVSQGGIRSFRIADANHDGLLDVVAEVEYRRTPYSKKLEQALTPLCKGWTGDNDPGTDKLLQKPAKDTFEFFLTGTSFRPSAKTARFLKTL